MNISFASNMKDNGVLAVIDTVTNAPVTASFAGITATSDNTGVATTVVNADNSVDIVGAGVGAANVTIEAETTYTDSTGTKQTAKLSTVVAVTVTQVITADSVALQVNFSAPVHQ